MYVNCHVADTRLETFALYMCNHLIIKEIDHHKEIRELTFRALALLRLHVINLENQIILPKRARYESVNYRITN